VNAANPGDTILVDSGTYNESVNCTKAVDLVGVGSDSTTIQGSGARWSSLTATARTLPLSPDLPLPQGQALTATASIYCKNGADPTISGNTIRGNGRDDIYCSSSSPTITNNVITGNSVYGISSSSSPPFLTPHKNYLEKSSKM